MNIDITQTYLSHCIANQLAVDFISGQKNYSHDMRKNRTASFRVVGSSFGLSCHQLNLQDRMYELSLTSDAESTFLIRSIHVRFDSQSYLAGIFLLANRNVIYPTWKEPTADWFVIQLDIHAMFNVHFNNFRFYDMKVIGIMNWNPSNIVIDLSQFETSFG